MKKFIAILALSFAVSVVLVPRQADAQAWDCGTLWQDTSQCFQWAEELPQLLPNCEAMEQQYAQACFPSLACTYFGIC